MTTSSHQKKASCFPAASSTVQETETALFDAGTGAILTKAGENESVDNLRRFHITHQPFLIMFPEHDKDGSLARCCFIWSSNQLLVITPDQFV